jgi:hypothetical protein
MIALTIAAIGDLGVADRSGRCRAGPDEQRVGCRYRADQHRWCARQIRGPYAVGLVKDATGNFTGGF